MVGLPGCLAEIPYRQSAELGIICTGTVPGTQSDPLSLDIVSRSPLWPVWSKLRLLMEVNAAWPLDGYGSYAGTTPCWLLAKDHRSGWLTL
jgi:hypothetical protein